MEHKYKKWILLASTTICLMSCSKEKPITEVAVANVSQNAIQPTYFEWDKVDYMPTPAGQQILVPWASNTNQSFPAEFINDYKREEGWELVYNTFNTSNNITPLFFVLYNKYRGVLRLYSYLSSVTPIPSNYITHTIKHRSNFESPILNFSSQEIVRADTAQKKASQIQPFQTTATGTWYAAEFEVAYDSRIAERPATTSMLAWDLNSVGVSQIKYDGSTFGNITGTISQPPPNTGLFPLIMNAIFDGAAFIGGVNALNALGLKPPLATPILGALNAGIQGRTTNIMNGIINGGPSGGSSARVNLKVELKHEFTGTATDYYPIHSIAMIIPGSKDQSTAPGYVPLYQKPLGIFNLRSTPLVKGKWQLLRVTSVHNRADIPTGGEFKLDTNSVVIDWNNSIINSEITGAKIKNLKKEIITHVIKENELQNPVIDLDDIETALPTGSYLKESFHGAQAAILPITSTLPQALDEESYTSGGEREEYETLKDRVKKGDILKYQFLRISFDVVPNNGTPKTTIVKTFSLKWDGINP